MVIFGLTFSSGNMWLLGFCVALLMAWVTYLFALALKNREAFNNAAKEFTKTFLTELAGLYPTPSQWPEHEALIDNILKNKFPRLEVAVAEFKRHLPPGKAKSLNNAWVKYYAEYGEEHGQSYYQYMPLSCPEVIAIDGTKSSYDYTKNYKAKFKKNIDHVLSFARAI